MHFCNTLENLNHQNSWWILNPAELFIPIVISQLKEFFFKDNHLTTHWVMRKWPQLSVQWSDITSSVWRHVDAQLDHVMPWKCFPHHNWPFVLTPYHIVYTPALFWHDVPIVLTYIYTLRFQAHSAGNLGRNSHVHNKATALLWSYLQ